VTFKSLRDAGTERLMNTGERLLGAVVATHRCAPARGVSRADRRGMVISGVMPAIERDLAGRSRAKRMVGEGTTNG
jgi:hypothetical protein